MRREIATKWRCGRSGDCCLAIPEIVCTPEEVAVMQSATPVHLTVEPHPDRRFVRVLTPNGCPLLMRELDGQATCTIHDVRPYQCRRFQCQRPDPATEPYEPGGPMGCKNLSDRLTDSLHALEFFRTNQRYAQRWATSHGWTKDMR